MMTATESQSLALKAVLSKMKELQVELNHPLVTLSIEKVFEDYIKNDDRAMYSLLVPYVKFYNEMGVKTQSELKHLIHFAKDLILFVQGEHQWNELLKYIDKQLTMALNGPNERKHTINFNYIRLDTIELFDCQQLKTISLANVLRIEKRKYVLIVLLRFFGCSFCYNHVKRLNETAQQLLDKDCGLIFVCRGSPVGAKKWIEMTEFTQNIYLDEKSQLIKALNQPRSIYTYSEIVMQLSPTLKIDLPSDVIQLEATIRRIFDIAMQGGKYVAEDKVQDKYQLGADLVVEAETGRVLFINRSKSMEDRPEPEEILNCFMMETKAPAKPLYRSKSCLVM